MRKQIESILSNLPKGKVTTYKAMADKLDSHPRGVASVLASNKDLENVHCYKVVNSQGGISGYAGGIENKISLLKNDGIEVIDNNIPEKYIIRNL